MTARMRTLDAAIAQLHTDDPGNCLTKHALRQWVLSGVVPHVRVGAKYLINYDILLAILAGEHEYVEPEMRAGTIRPIEMKVANRW